MIAFDQLTWLHGKPQSSGLLKANPEDFLVVEDLGFAPDGEGEHVLVRILKNGCNTRFVADALAKFLKIHAREVSFAGQKDKHAVTEQWLCARVPGKEMPDLSKFQLEGCQVLEYARHKRKLRLGALKGNQFTVILREISDRQDVETRLQAIAERGVPNYFGAQRFGIGGSNLQGALRWAESGAPVRDRNKRSFWLSAARSALFYQQVSIRLKKTEFNQVVDGDALQLAGRGSWFVVTPEELEVSQARVHNRELMITATLPGSGDWGSQRDALAFEQAAIAEETALQALLVREKVEAARRAMLLYPQQLSWNWWDDVTVELRFWRRAASPPAWSGSLSIQRVTMRILLSNDDGIHAPGIQTLAKALREFAEVQVVAPDRNRSGASNSLTLESSLRTFTFENGDIAVQMGTPTDCVYLGVNALMRPRPDIVVSGINAGPNLGDDVIYSGTVAAAMEGRHLGFPALAVSLNGYQHYDTAAAVTCTILRALSREPLRTGRILNINVPDLPLDQIKGIRVTRCGNRHPADQVIPQQDPRGNTLYWIGPPGDKCDAGPGTDFAAVDEGYVSVTPLHVDLTAHQAHEVVTDWLERVGVDRQW